MLSDIIMSEPFLWAIFGALAAALLGAFGVIAQTMRASSAPFGSPTIDRTLARLPPDLQAQAEAAVMWSERATKDMQTAATIATNLAAEIQESRRREIELVAALRYYADPRTYEPTARHSVWQDRGKIARTTLDPVPHQ